MRYTAQVIGVGILFVLGSQSEALGRGFGAGGARGGAAVGPRGGAAAGGARGGAAVGPRGGAAAGGSRAGAAVGPYGGVHAGAAQGGAAVGPRGGVATGGSRAGVSAGPFGGARAGGAQGGSYTGPRGTTVQAGRAGGVAVGPYGGVHAGAAQGARVTTPGGRTFGTGSAGRVGVGPYGGVRAGGARGTAVSGPNGAAAAGRRGGVAVGPYGGAAGGWRGGAAVGSYGGVGAARAVGVGHATRYVSPVALGNRAGFVRGGFGYRCFTPSWYRTHTAAWVAPRWRTSNFWVAPAWPVVSTWCGVTAAPILYDYGSNVVLENNNVYVNGDPVTTCEQYADQALAFATVGRQAQPPEDQEWQPLGVFGMIQGEETVANHIFQLAINRDGIVRGNYYDAVGDNNLPVYGSVDRASQRIAWSIGEKKDVVFETGLNNLTQPQTTLLVHYGKEGTQEMLLVRLEEPKTDDKVTR